MTFHGARAGIHRFCWLLGVLSGLVLSALPTSGKAQVTTTITPDGTLGTTVTQGGSIHTITGGTIRGPNLFHSFDRFSVGTGDTARFTGPPSGIDYILSRVTGGHPSTIDGTLQSDIPGANFFLLNPSGVLFGPHAELDVRGSFHVSTADVLRLADGGRLAASLAQPSVLTVAPPVAFGFLRENPAAIVMQEGSALAIPTGETLSLSGGNIEIAGGFLTAPGGQIALASVASSGDVVLNATRHAPRLQINSVERLGEITLSQGARIDASGDHGGTVIVRGRRLMIDGSRMSANTLGAATGAPIGIDVDVSGDVVLTNAARITADAEGSGDVGDIRMIAGGIQLDTASVIRSVAFAEGRAGDIVVQATTVTVRDGAAIFSTTFGPGQGSNVTVSATETLTLSGTTPDRAFASGIAAQSRGPGAQAGDAGTVVVEAHDITIRDGAVISSLTIGPGQGGNVTVSATETLTLIGTTPDGMFASGIGANAQGTGAQTGDAGTVMVEASDITIRDGAMISSTTFGPGQGGNVRVTATATLTLIGTTPNGAFSRTDESGSYCGA